MGYCKHFLVLLFIYTGTFGQAQQIITIDFDQNISQGIGQLLLLSLGVDVVLDNGVDVYRVTYLATGSDMRPDTASGLLMLPEQIDGPVPLLVYQHGTTEGRSAVPSNLGGGYQLGAIMAGKGMAVIAPDFLGMGTSRGFHPYVHARTEATAAVDLMDAVLAYFDEEDITWNKQLFVTGYSQGGHAAMALHQYIQEEIPDRYSVTASLPMSGPYNISGVMRDLAFTDEPYAFPAYLVYSSRGFREIDPTLYEDESDLFKQAYIPAINKFVSTGEGLFDLNESLVQSLIAAHGQAIPKQIFKDSILNELEMDPDHPFNAALRENDVHDWAAEAPVLMLYCTSDDQVPFRNSVVADSTMNALGATNTTAMDVSNGMNLDHTDCIVPALNTGIPWILGFVDNTVPTFDLLSGVNAEVFPNPSSGIVHISSEIVLEKVTVYTLNGQKVFDEIVQSRRHSMNLKGLSRGMYVTQLYTADGLIVKKIMLQ